MMAKRAIKISDEAGADDDYGSSQVVRRPVRPLRGSASSPVSRRATMQALALVVHFG
jgi:hypothetical protein